MNEMVKLESLNDVTTFASEVKKFIFKQNLWMDIQGKGYVFVDGWQLVGGLLGINPLVEEVENLSADGVYKYRATVKLMRGDQIVSSGVAICSSEEPGKGRFAEYAVASMSQTRAIGKAYRLYIGWIMAIAGFQSTPLEDMQDEATPSSAINVDAVKAKIKQAKSYDDLMDILGELEPDMQKKVTPLVDSRAKELNK